MDAGDVPSAPVGHDSTRAQTGRLLRNVASRTVAELGAKVSTVVLFTVMAHKLGDEGVGVFVFALSVSALATTLADFGQDKVVVREVARDHDALVGYYANTMAVRIVVGLPLLLVAILVVPRLGYDGEAQLALLLVGAGVLVDFLANTTFAVFQAYERVGYLSAVLLVERWLLAVGGIAALLLGAGVVTVSAIFLLSSFVAVAMAQLLLRRVVRVRLVVDVRAWLPLMKASAPLGLAGLFGTILFRIDTAMLGVYEAADVVGNYGVAYRLFETTLFVSWSVNTAFYPVFSRLAAGSERLGRTFEQAVKLAMSAVLPVAVGLAVLAEPLVQVAFGSDFDRAPRAVLLLAPAVAFYPISYLGGYLAVSQNRERLLTALYGGVALVNVLLNLVLIPRFSLSGAAVSTAIAEGLAAIGAVLIARRLLGSIDWVRALGGPVTAVAFAGGAMWLLRGQLVAAIVVGAAVYVGLLMAVERRRHPDDLASVIDVVRGRH